MHTGRPLPELEAGEELYQLAADEILARVLGASERDAQLVPVLARSEDRPYPEPV